MDRTNDISQGIDITISQDTACMRAFVCKGEDLFFEPGNTDLSSVHFGNGNIVVGKVQFVEVVSDLVPNHRLKVSRFSGLRVL
jgi:hypothetical protein